MVKNHPFVDANKRTAWLVMTLLIARSGYDLVLQPTDRIDDFVVDVADDRLDFTEIQKWIKARLQKSDA